MDKMTDKIKVKPFDNLFMRCHFGFGSKLVGLCKGKCWPVFSGSCWLHAVLMKAWGGKKKERKPKTFGNYLSMCLSFVFHLVKVAFKYQMYVVTKKTDSTISTVGQHCPIRANYA